MFREQDDQIGRIFAYWTIVLFFMLLLKIRDGAKMMAYFLPL
jgi:hypothetical protein